MAGGRIWKREEEDFLAELVARGLSVEETVERFNARFDERTTSAIHSRRSAPYVKKRADKLRNLDQKLPPLPDKPSPEDIQRHAQGQAVPGVYDEAPSLETDFEDAEYHSGERLWNRAKKETSQAIDYHSKRHRARIRFPAIKPIALTFISDQHISEGAPVNLERMEADAKIVQDTAGLYAVLGGDGVDGHIKHRSAIIASGSKPGHEWLMYDHYLGLFGHKIAAMISGNHDDWTKDFTDFDVVGMLAKKHRIFYAPDYVLLRVGFEGKDAPAETEYIIKVRHQYRYSSSFNQTHSVKRMWEMDDDDFDVGVVCHKHETALEPFVKHGLQRWALRPGSYQYTSGHSRRYGYRPSEPTCPTIIFLPDQRAMIGFWDIRPAASYLAWLRQGWPDTGEVFAA